MVAAIHFAKQTIDGTFVFAHPPGVFVALVCFRTGPALTASRSGANLALAVVFSEKVNLQIMEQLEAEGIPFAAPGLTVQMADDEKPGLNARISTSSDEREGELKADGRSPAL